MGMISILCHGTRIKKTVSFNTQIRNQILRIQILHALCTDEDINKPLVHPIGYPDDQEAPLLRIAGNDHLTDIVALLLHAGADITQVSNDVFTRSNALFIASAEGAYENLKKFLNFLDEYKHQQMSDILKQPNHIMLQSPLHGAVQRGHYRCVKLLLRAHACPNDKDRFGATPLHVCASNLSLSLGQA